MGILYLCICSDRPIVHLHVRGGAYIKKRCTRHPRAGLRTSSGIRCFLSKLQPLDLNETVRRAVRVFEAAGNTGAAGVGASGSLVTPVLDLDDELGTIEADPDLLHRVVQKLVLNALDATGTKSRLPHTAWRFSPITVLL
jgi:signal transduction histidine kinase